ncbi:MAG: lipopolysaccharide biosynthesis protein, partial [Bacteroides sp.]|nr:lipopolysaccharide biosynthesis protein [Bacteroides sp.]
RGIATQVQGAVNSFVGNFQMAVNPQIIKSYAADEKEYMTSLIIQSSKYSFYLLFLLSLPIILEVDQILKLWLIIVPDYAAIFTILVLVIILITCISGPLMTAVQATGKIALYQAVVGTLLFLTLPVSYVFLKLGYPPEVTLYITIVIEIIALIFRFFFLKRLINFPVLHFVKEVILRNIPIIIVSSFIPLIIKKSLDENLWRLLIIVFISIIWSLIVIYFIGLNRSEKKTMKIGFLKILSRIKD